MIIKNILHQLLTISIGNTSITLVKDDGQKLDLSRLSPPLKLTLSVREGRDAEAASAWIIVTFALEKTSSGFEIAPLKDTPWFCYRDGFLIHKSLHLKFPVAIKDGILIVGTLDMDRCPG